MSKVVTQASVSLDGFIAGPENGGFEYLFAWCRAGEVEVPTASPGRSYKVSEASAAYVRDMIEGYGALVVGRNQFDGMNGWGGQHPMNVQVFVVTHSVPEGWAPESAEFVFVTEGGVKAAIDRAKAVAGDKNVGVGPGVVAREALEERLLDEIRVDLVPFMLGDGVRFVDTLGTAPLGFGDPQVIQGKKVTHLIYPVETGG
ncbi:dihydrofolate reductase family protein [Amycolatopsis sp. NPDC058340]|uniref:dihydrofolate reductase family protein n=1 Tax=Amycolatopsis sp. NPDC058340 TaxID=3346453 RepID=UPI003668CB4F